MAQDPPAAPVPAPVAHLQLKAALLLALFVLLVGATALYLLYARGSFEATQRLVLLAEDSEGVSVGMDLTFAGFPIGRVRRVELGDDGNVRILIDVPSKDAHRLRTSSIFTLVRSLVGGANLRAYSGVPSDPPLPPDAQRKVLVGDAAAELPRLVAAARDLLGNLVQLSAPDGALATSLAASLANVQALSEQAKGPSGALGLLAGTSDARQISTALARTNALLVRLDGLAARADTQLLGPDGLVRESRATLAQLGVQLGELLGAARGALKQVDAVLAEAQGVAANARAATTDLTALRSEVDATVRKVEQLVDEVNRKWPFARDTELKLR